MADHVCGVRTRFAADPAGGFAADLDGTVVGSNLATTSGSPDACAFDDWR